MHDGSHGEDCFGCRIKSIQFDPRAMPSRRNQVPPAATFHQSNSWENGIAKDSRNMPILGPSGAPMGVKEYGEQRHRVEAERARLAQHPNPFPSESLRSL